MINKENICHLATYFIYITYTYTIFCLNLFQAMRVKQPNGNRVTTHLKLKNAFKISNWKAQNYFIIKVQVLL